MIFALKFFYTVTIRWANLRPKQGSSRFAKRASAYKYDNSQ